MPLNNKPSAAPSGAVTMNKETMTMDEHETNDHTEAAQEIIHEASGAEPDLFIPGQTQRIVARLAALEVLKIGGTPARQLIVSDLARQFKDILILSEEKIIREMEAALVRVAREEKEEDIAAE